MTTRHTVTAPVDPDTEAAIPVEHGGRPGTARPAGPGRDGLVRVLPTGVEPVPLRYWMEGPFVYVLSTDGSAGWAAAVLRRGGCELEVPNGLARTVSAALVDNPAEAARARDGVRAKYGPEVWVRYVRAPGRVVRFDLRSPPRAPSAEERVRQELDAIAPGYTPTVGASPLQRYVKDRTAAWLVREMRGSDPLLEIGPGSGYETLPLLAAGHRVLAVDVSSRMLGELVSRARAAGLADRLTTRVAPLRSVGEALAGFPPGTFGGAYSTFGAFNLENDLAECASALGRAIRPGGRLIFTTLNYPGAAPFTWELLVGDGRGAMARLSRDMPADDVRYSLDVHLRSPAFWDRLLTPGFERVDARPLSVLVPPFESPRLLRLLGAEGRRRAKSIDAALSRHGLFSPIAEWVLVSYRRRGAQPAGRSGLEEGPVPAQPGESTASPRIVRR
jgi:SAM-dependent methyltransferase